MGCGTSKPAEDNGLRQANEKNAEIERSIRQDRKNEDRTVKILLLGI